MMPISDFTKQRILNCFITLFIAFVAAEVNRDHDDASFYGESYVLTPIEDANSSTSITLDFRTNQPHGLLFLAAGETDYVLVHLNNGVVETRINLGSGEAVVFSARGVRLDDKRWHQLVINRTLDAVYVMIDGIGQGQGSTPGPYHNLNVDLGVFLGGPGKLTKDVYRNTKSFRGCLRDVSYNGLSVLQEASEHKNYHNIFQVAWHCDDEFFAPSSSEINFSSDTSYVAFPFLRIFPSSDNILSCDFKTRSQNAILLFNSGKGKAWEDFLAVELVDGRPKLSVDKGSGVIEAYLTHAVNDGKWHRLEVSLSDSEIQLKVDGSNNRTRFNLGGQNVLNLASYMYIGGVGYNARPLAVKLGLTSLQSGGKTKGSILGCVRNIHINSRQYGFQQIEMSRLVHPDCGWDFPCADEPCLQSATCVELEGPEFRCDCQESVCVKDKFKSMSLERNKVIDGILSVNKLEVVAGSEKVIDESNINLGSNIMDAIEKEDGVAFRIMEMPKFGVMVKGKNRINSFTLLDLRLRKVVYRQNGEASDFDSAVFQVIFGDISQEGESKLKDRYEFVLPIHIMKIPANSKPIHIVLGRGNILQITANARIQITRDILDIDEYTVDASRLTFEIKFLRSARSRFEHIGQAGDAVLSFTYRDVLDGSIWFVHGGDQIVYTTVSISDGVTKSSPVDLRFKMEKLKLSVVNNTGLFMEYGSSHIISSYNLSCRVNVKIEKIELMYRVARSPKHGVIQRMDRNDGQWMNVDKFTQSDLESGLIKYLHLPGQTVANYDEVWLEVVAKDVKTSQFVLNIRYKTVTLYVDNEFDMYLHQVLFAKMTSHYLSVKSNAESLDFSKIVFTIHRKPREGSLYKINKKDVEMSDLDSSNRLSAGDQFTQQDINNDMIYYKVNHQGQEESEDYIDFHASYLGFTIMVRNRVVYFPTRPDLLIINEGLEGVSEGGFKIITEDMLAVDVEDFDRYSFSVLRRPRHGALNVLNPLTSETERINTTHFTMVEILDRTVMYLHDDSEHDADSFTFSAIPIIKTEAEKKNQDLQDMTGTFNIKISMRNDNAPVRTVNNVFHVVKDDYRHLTNEDLAFEDPDINFDSSNLKYNLQFIPNGRLVNRITSKTVFNFTQKDLEDSNLVFWHKGENYGRVPLSVTDGKYFTNGLLEIQASSRYIQMVGKSNVKVESRHSVVISLDNIAVESNVDLTSKRIRFDVLDGPKFGYLHVRGRERNQFYYHDIKAGQVVYFNDKESEEDFVKFSISVPSLLTNESSIYIEIGLDGINDPPQIINNQILEVIAFHAETITENYLLIEHKDYTDKDIQYVVTKLPERGFLTVKGKPQKRGNTPKFTQQDVEDSLITYTSESAEISYDRFIFDVNTEHQTLRNIKFLISVVNSKNSQSQINQANLTLSEGESVRIPMTVLSIDPLQIRHKSINILLDKVPSHGQIIMHQNPVTSFPISSLAQGLVSYVHDNSETTSDQFTLQAIELQPSLSPSSSSSSDVPFHHQTFINVKINPVDDLPPRVIVNTGLKVWTGSLTLLTDAHLKATDQDSPTSMLTFKVTSGPTNGHLAYLHNTFRAISTFSQADVDDFHVVFVHKGSNAGEFQFQVSDGTNQDQVRTFRIMARQVKLFLGANGPLQAFPNSLQPITNTTLSTSPDNHDYNHSIVYSVINPPPSKGRIVILSSERLSEIKTFKQEDINQNKIFYQHTRQMRSWDESDSILFEITSPYATSLYNQRIPIQISFSNLNYDNYRSLLGINTPSVLEGKQITLTKEYFDSSQFVQRIQSFRPYVKVEFSFVSWVSHGSLWFNDMDAVMGGVFTQQDIDNGHLVYNHDDTDTTRDQFQFAVKIMVPRQNSNSNSKPPPTVFNFTIDVEQVNDFPFELLTRFPKIEVTQGQDVIVTSNNLSTIDMDTGPEGIQYEILKQPAIGKFVQTSISPTARISSFTQKDVNDGLVMYKHDGSPHSGDTMDFKVSDRVFQPKYGTVQISIIPIKIRVAEKRAVTITQGQRSVFLSNQQLRVSTNGDLSKLEYKVTQSPQFGKLMKGGLLVTEFSQVDVDDGFIVYVMDMDSPGDDFFVCDIDLDYIESSLDVVQFDIVMKPLVKQGPTLTASGTHIAITRSSLDASELAQLTNDDPQFKITASPRFGQIMMKSNRKRRSIQSENYDHEEDTYLPITSFTNMDIAKNKIYYVANGGPEAEDRFLYKLSARGVPPANGEYVIQLEPATGGNGGKGTDGKHVDTDITSTQATSSEDKGGGGEDEVVKGSAMGAANDGDNTAIIIGVVIASIVLIIIVIVLAVLFIRWKRQRNQDPDCNQDKFSKPRPYISGPLQLEQPHVFIEPHSDNDDSPTREEDTALMTPSSKTDDMYVNASVFNNSQDMADTGQWIRDHDKAVTIPSPVFRQHSNSNGFSGGDGDDDNDGGGGGGGGCGEAGGGAGGRGSNASGDLIEWTLMDPDLLQHCYNSQPVLRNNQYWL